MATAPTLSSSGDFNFVKDGAFLDNQVSASIQVTASNVPGLALAITNDAPFPAPIVNIAKVTAKVSGGTGSIAFGGGNGTVSFDGSVAANAGFGAYAKAADLLNDLDTDNTILTGLSLPSTGVARFVALDWGYNISAAAKGSVALGFGASVTFSAKGQTSGLFTVIRAFQNEPGARTAIEETIRSWMLPRQVESIADLAPGTWIVAEVDGEFGATIGAKFGYDYSWLRNVNLQGLSGDVGLRIAAAAAISVGFDISGKYLAVVARESLNPADQIARVRLFKMSKKGWNFALNASIGVTGNTGTFLPGELDDFIAGIFGVHGSQLVKDLQTFRSWTDPNTPLDAKFAGFVTDFVNKELTAHGGTLLQKINDARTLVQGFLDKWDDLPHTVSSLVWTQLRQGGQIAADLETGLRLVAGGTDAQITAQVKDALSDVSFLRAPLGQWLESVALGDLLTVVDNNAEIKNLRDSAQQIVDLLDGKVLQNLVDFVNQNLQIDLIKNIVSQPPLDALDKWLQSKLTDFIGKTIDLSGLEQIRKTLDTIETKAADLYKSAVAALNNTYTASLVATYSKATTKTALFDISFDFATNPALGQSLSDVIDGNWKAALVDHIAGVTINQAVLTHDVKRQSHVEITLPHFNTALDKFNDAASTMTFQSEDGGVYFFELTANDSITRRRKWQSSVSLTSKIAVNAAKVNVFPSDSDIAEGSKYAYTLLMPRKNLRTTELEQLFTPVMNQYFPDAFNAPLKATFPEWIADLDNHADLVENNGTLNLGNTTIKLELAVPGKCVAAWFKAPGKNSSLVPYQVMSRNIQAALRKFIPLCYFDDINKYIAQPSAASLFVYSSLPVSTGIKFDGSTLTLDADIKTLFWEYDDPRDSSVNERAAMVNSALTKQNLRVAMGMARTILGSSSLAPFATDYADTDTRINTIRQTALGTNLNDTNSPLIKLLRSESETIDHALQAGRALAAFQTLSTNDPEAALTALSDFGAAVTATFNSNLGDLFGGPVIRALGSAIFIEAAKAFDSTIANVVPAARFDITLLRITAPATWREDFLAGKSFAPSVISLEQPVINV